MCGCDEIPVIARKEMSSADFPPLLGEYSGTRSLGTVMFAAMVLTCANSSSSGKQCPSPPRRHEKPVALRYCRSDLKWSAIALAKE